jgi:DNA-cytosine methyltransferase
VEVTNYFSCEIDKYAVKVSEDNYPDITRLGDINDWHSWGLDPSKIDLILAGSPCQGFSFAGKQLAFNDPRSALFFTFIDILNWVKAHNPDVKFLLENVKMKKEHLAVITDRVGVEPVLINSALVSAQNRQRYYWANWDFEQPEDKGVLLGDIIDDRCQKPNGDGWHKWWKDKKDFQIKKRYSSIVNNGSTDKAICMTARQYASWNGNFYKIGSMVGRKINPNTGVRDDYNKDLSAIQRIELRSDDKTGTITTVQKDNLLVENCEKYRNLTPLECERLQTVPDNYTKAVSNSQRYKMLGNGWTVNIITHIFRSWSNNETKRNTRIRLHKQILQKERRLAQ